MSLFDEPSRKPFPATPALEDHRTAVIKGALGAIPILGSVLVEELGLVLAPPLSRRRDEWFEDLARRLHDLESTVTGFNFDDLANNEQFVSATLQATQAALRTHQEEKLEALRNAVLNAAASHNFSDEQQGIFLSLVDTLQPIHLRLLKAMRKEDSTSLRFDGFEWLKDRVAGLQNFDRKAFKMFIDELGRSGLVNVTNDVGRLLASGERWITPWGFQFLAFITEPRG